MLCSACLHILCISTISNFSLVTENERCKFHLQFPRSLRNVLARKLKKLEVTEVRNECREDSCVAGGIGWLTKRMKETVPRGCAEEEQWKE